MPLPYLHGLASGFSLIVAIGIQNAFVLTSGIRGSHVLTVTLICILGDVLLITLGVLGLGSLLAASQLCRRFALGGGAAFLFAYGLLSLRAARRGGRLEAQAEFPASRRSVVLAALAVTLLNPHVYLDTVVLLGSLSSRFPDGQRLQFAAGAVTASCLWFTSLGLGARLLAPIFRSPLSWRLLDTCIGLTMLALGGSLLASL